MTLFFSGHQVIKMDDHSFLEKTYSFAGETPTQWLNSNIPELSYSTYRRKQVNANDFFLGFRMLFWREGKKFQDWNKKSKYHCKSFFKVLVKDGIAKITNGNFSHTHPTDEQFLSAWIRPSHEVCKNIIDMTKKGDTCHYIRKTLHLTIDSQMFYNRPFQKPKSV